MLVWCIDKLEELGLISWKKESNCVHIHGLTLKGVREMLLENHLFLTKLLSLFSCGATSRISCTAERISNSLFGFLMCNVLSSTAGFLSTGSFGLWFDEHQRVFDFLSGVLDQNCLQHVAKSSATVESGKLILLTFRSMVAIILFRSSMRSVLVDERAYGWMEVYSKFPLNEQENRIMNVYNRNSKGILYPLLGLNYGFENSASLVKTPSYISTIINIFTSYQEFSGTSNDDLSMHFHVVVAVIIDSHSRQTARRFYLQTASKSCPQLLTEPIMLEMETVLQNVQAVASKFFEEEEFLIITEIGTKMNSWKYLLVF